MLVKYAKSTDGPFITQSDTVDCIYCCRFYTLLSSKGLHELTWLEKYNLSFHFKLLLEFQIIF